MEKCINAAEDYLTKHQWGVNGRFLGVSRMFKDEDIHSLTKSKMFASQRPRGILSGFLAIIPGIGAVYIPPISGKVLPTRIRMRVKVEKGAIFSAYWREDLILEDILVWNDEPIWFTKTFEERWKIMKLFIETCYKPDIVQGGSIKAATYQSLQSLIKPSDNTVIEFIPNEPKQKRLIWMAERKPLQNTNTNTKSQESVNDFTLKKEPNSGPDVYTVYRAGEKLGYALVKTLAISKALRAFGDEEIKVEVEWNNHFGKWEVLKVL
jgi:hypothetical protein